MLKKLPYLVLACIAFLFVACEPTKIELPPVLISSNQIVFYDNTLLSRVKTSNDSLIYQSADYQVSINRVSYRTTAKDGTPITASGVVYIPKQLSGAKSYPLLSFQHPTAFSNAEAPSGNNFAAVSFSYPLYFATHGYIVACPDYIGYGIADYLPHDYEHRQTLAQTTVDMLLAAKELLAQKKVACTDQVFMAGYSEGGYATLSAQQLLEDKYSNAFHVAGSSCGAGPYAMPAFFDYVTQKTSAGGIANYLYAWATLSYDRIYGLKRPTSYYFKAPYAEQITKSLENARTITASFNQICTDQFLAEVRNPSSLFRKALSDNDISNWAPKSPTQLIHSEEDEIIPFLTSQQTYASMRQRGATKVDLIALKKGAHVPTEVLFMSRSLSYFERLKK